MEDFIKLISSLQTKRKTPILLLFMKEVDTKQIIELTNTLGDKKIEKLDIIIQTPGGNIESAYKMIKILKKHSKELNFIIPLYSKSAGTLICLSADSVSMTELSELGPLDTQLIQRGVSGLEQRSALDQSQALQQIQILSDVTLSVTVDKLIRQYGIKIDKAIELATEFTSKTISTLYTKFDVNKIGEYSRTLEMVTKYGTEILMRYRGVDEDNAQKLIDSLVRRFPSHSYIIDSQECDKLGIPLKKDIDDEEYDIIYAIGKHIMKHNLDETLNFIEFVDYTPPVIPTTAPTIQAVTPTINPTTPTTNPIVQQENSTVNGE